MSIRLRIRRHLDKDDFSVREMWLKVGGSRATVREHLLRMVKSGELEVVTGGTNRKWMPLLFRKARGDRHGCRNDDRCNGVGHAKVP